MTTSSPSLGNAAARQRLIKLIHVAKNDLQMTEDDYRQALRTASNGRVESSAEMTVIELEKVVSHMKRCGFKVRTKAKKRPAKPQSSRALATDPESRKIRALWLFLHDLGAVKNPSEAALAAYVKRITRVDALQWVRSGEQIETLIESLKKWAMRYLPAAIQQLVDEVKLLPLTDIEQERLLSELSVARTRGTFDPMESAWQYLTELKNGAAG